jgi:hypothetical protein
MDGKGSALISDASLEHLRKRIASFKAKTICAGGGWNASASTRRAIRVSLR